MKKENAKNSDNLVKDQAIDLIREDLKKIEIERNTKSIILFSIGYINSEISLEFLNIIRKEGKIQNLDVILDSGGGDIDAAFKIAGICKDFSNKFSVIVPFYAKSAATLIALYADELILCRAGELGPVDPQVKHPILDLYFSASSIKNALQFIESSTDPYIKMTMADKLDPLLIGAYNRTIEESKQYLEEVPKIKNSIHKDEIINVFTEKYIDHAYPIYSKNL